MVQSEYDAGAHSGMGDESMGVLRFGGEDAGQSERGDGFFGEGDSAEDYLGMMRQIEEAVIAEILEQGAHMHAPRGRPPHAVRRCNASRAQEFGRALSSWACVFSSPSVGP